MLVCRTVLYLVCFLCAVKLFDGVKRSGCGYIACNLSRTLRIATHQISYTFFKYHQENSLCTHSKMLQVSQVSNTSAAAGAGTNCMQQITEPTQVLCGAE